MPTPTGSMDVIAQSFIEAFNLRDAEGLVALADPEIEFHPTPLVHGQSTYHGHDGLRCWLEEIGESGIGHRVRVHDVRKLDENHFLILSDVLIGDEPISPLTILGRLSNAREIVEVHAFLSDERMLAQVGVTPANTEKGTLSELA
ncbi:MAG: nuclear transport factor 2 family protein [Solirubrobacterales bacterium]